MQEQAVDQLRRSIEADFPHVEIYEVSVEHGIEISESMQAMATSLAQNRDFFIRQKFQQHLSRLVVSTSSDIDAQRSSLSLEKSKNRLSFKLTDTLKDKDD